ncbi:MAG: hypothetical protein U0804_02845 [Gemmataceae bacterium]
MSLEKFLHMFPPPKTPTGAPTANEWNRIQNKLSESLPDELFRFHAAYGVGTFRGEETTALSVCFPSAYDSIENTHHELQRLRDIRGASRSEDQPFDVFPDSGGLLPLGLDENDVWLCWATVGRPENWPIVVRWTWGVQGMRTFHMPLSELMVALFERTIELPCWPLPTFIDNVRFVPYQA